MEFFQEFGGDVSVTISPRGQGIMEVFLDGERIYNKKTEGNIHPNLIRVRVMKDAIASKLEDIKEAESLPAAAGDG